jgi:hypothetical protein
MSETASAQPGSPGAQSSPSALRLTLNSDGLRHPLLNTVTVFTFLTGVASFVTGLIVHLHVVATVTGLVSFAVGLFAQMNSATREERILIVAGLVAGFVGMGLGIAHGGFA